MAYGTVDYADIVQQARQVNPSFGAKTFGITAGIAGTGAPNTNTANTLAPYQANFSALYPQLGATQGAVSGNTLARLRGELSPETLSAIQDKAARFGIGIGMPQSGISSAYGRKLLGTTIEGLQSQGLKDYLDTLKSYSGTLMPTPGEVIGAETSRYGTDVGAATARRGQDVSAGTASAQLGQQAHQFGLTFPESQRQYDISATLQNQQSQNQLGLGYANLGQNYLNSYLNFLS